MHFRRWLCALAVVVGGAAAVTTSPATPAYKGCGLRGYAYAGLQSDREAFGVTATLTALAEPLVERGHVAAWVGVGAPGEGPHGTDEWFQVGLNRIAGNQPKLYYEVARPSGIRYVELGSNVPAGRRYHVAVLEMAGRTDVWRVWVNGRPASEPIYLPRSHATLTPMALAENWDGDVPACNRYKYGFRRVSLARSPGGSWAPLRTQAAQLVQDRGYRILPSSAGGFVAVTSPPPLLPSSPNRPHRPVLPKAHRPAPTTGSAPSSPAPSAPAPTGTSGDPIAGQSQTDSRGLMAPQKGECGGYSPSPARSRSR
jgi:hypothetical protein